MDKNNSAFVLMAIVAIVAIVGISTLLFSRTITFRPSEAGAAYGDVEQKATYQTTRGECVARPFEGFGATTLGGQGKPVYHVTSLANSGAGTLRDALSQGNRYVVFDVAGTITLTSVIYVRNSFITIDGSTAPSPGITITYTPTTAAAVSLETTGCHDIIVKDIRFRTSGYDALRIYNGAYNIVVDHCSLTGPNGDGNLDITEGSHDVTVQWSIVGDNVKNQLIRYTPKDISLHHNIYLSGDTRNPLLDLDTSGVFDMVNNLIFDWAGSGTEITGYSNGNLIANYYLPGPRTPASKHKRAVLIGDGSGGGYYGQMYMQGNVMPPENDPYFVGFTTYTRFAAPAVTTMPAEEMFNIVLNEAGACPRDDIDQAMIEEIPGYEPYGCEDYGGTETFCGEIFNPDCDFVNDDVCCGDDTGEYVVNFVGQTRCCNNPGDSIDSLGRCVTPGKKIKATEIEQP